MKSYAVRISLAILAVVLCGCYQTVTSSDTVVYRTNRITGQVVMCAIPPGSAPLCVEMVGDIVSFETVKKTIEANQQQ